MHWKKILKHRTSEFWPGKIPSEILRKIFLSIWGQNFRAFSHCDLARSCSTAFAGLEKWFWISQNSKTYPPADPGILGVKIQWILEFPCRRQAPKFLPVFCMAPHGRAYMEIPESNWNFSCTARILEFPRGVRAARRAAGRGRCHSGISKIFARARVRARAGLRTRVRYYTKFSSYIYNYLKACAPTY